MPRISHSGRMCQVARSFAGNANTETRCLPRCENHSIGTARHRSTHISSRGWMTDDPPTRRSMVSSSNRSRAPDSSDRRGAMKKPPLCGLLSSSTVPPRSIGPGRIACKI